MSIRPLLVLGLVSIAPLASLLACTSLTTPPEPEEISTTTLTAASASAAFSGAQLKKSAADLVASAKAAAAPPADLPPEKPLDIKTLVAGTGPAAKAGDSISVDYIGTLADSGKEFDRSKGKPFTLKLGAGQVIKGWDQGLVGMKQGEKRKLTIPASLAYGARGYPPVIPPNSALVFEVTMEKITPGP
jgi:FKBP-type peptidyl-prolyl cis-trans isomerase